VSSVIILFAIFELNNTRRSPEAVPPQLRAEILAKIEATQQHASEMADLMKPKVG